MKKFMNLFTRQQSEDEEQLERTLGMLKSDNFRKPLPKLDKLREQKDARLELPTDDGPASYFKFQPHDDVNIIFSHERDYTAFRDAMKFPLKQYQITRNRLMSKGKFFNHANPSTDAREQRLINNLFTGSVALVDYNDSIGTLKKPLNILLGQEAQNVFPTQAPEHDKIHIMKLSDPGNFRLDFLNKCQSLFRANVPDSGSAVAIKFTEQRLLKHYQNPELFDALKAFMENRNPGINSETIEAFSILKGRTGSSKYFIKPIYDKEEVKGNEHPHSPLEPCFESAVETCFLPPPPARDSTEILLADLETADDRVTDPNKPSGSSLTHQNSSILVKTPNALMALQAASKDQHAKIYINPAASKVRS